MSSQNEHYIDYMGWHLPKIYALNCSITDSDDWENNKRGMKYRIFYIIIMCFMQKLFYHVDQLESKKYLVNFADNFSCSDIEYFY